MRKEQKGDNNFGIKNLTKSPSPKISFEKIKEILLGEKYELSLVFIGNKRSQDLNRRYRNKNKPTNVLSFGLTKTSGEIFLNLSKIKKESIELNEKFKKRVCFLFIHGILHLKGMGHGSRMERLEANYLKKFGF